MQQSIVTYCVSNRALTEERLEALSEALGKHNDSFPGPRRF